jgi:DNA-binding MarR family transcriptional regulator
MDVTADPLASANTLDQLAARLRLAIGRIQRRLSRHVLGDLTLNQLSALATISVHAPVRVGDLAALEGVSAPALSRAIANLEAAGFVERLPDPDDARAHRLVPSPKGTSQLEAFRGARTTDLAQLLTELDDTHLAAITAALPALETLANASRRPGAAPGIIPSPPTE